MEHKITVVELVINPNDLCKIVQDWAEESKFSMHETSTNRAIYSRRFLLAKAWLSIQHHEDKSKLEAWLSSPGLGPDFQGDAWKGWKIALPTRFGYGAPGKYKKKFSRLLKLLSNKAASIAKPKVEKQVNQANPTHQPKLGMNKPGFAKALVLLGILKLVTGSSSIMVAVSALNNPFVPNISGSIFSHGALEVLLGTLILVSSRALAKGKVLSIWLYGSSILFDVLGNAILGAKMNYLMIAVGMFAIWHLIELQKAGELS